MEMESEHPMHREIVSVHRARKPERRYDRVLWTRQDRLLAPVKGKAKGNRPKGEVLFHGAEAWASVEGREGRLKVKFDSVRSDFPFPEVFRMREEARRARALKDRAARKLEIDAAYRRSKELSAKREELHKSGERAESENVLLRPIAI